MCQHGKNGTNTLAGETMAQADPDRAAEQSEGGKTVGVDPAVITARRS